MTDMHNPADAQPRHDTPDPHGSYRLDLHAARAWLSGDVDIRLPKAWLLTGAAALVVLLALAFD